jgi:hypothetical protein
MAEARALSADIAVCSHNDSFVSLKQWIQADPVGYRDLMREDYARVVHLGTSSCGFLLSAHVKPEEE